MQTLTSTPSAPSDGTDVPKGPDHGVVVATVHNANSARNNYLFPHIDRLVHALSADGKAVKLEAWSQPQVTPHGVAMALARDFMYFKLHREWSRYRGLEVKSSLRAMRVFLKNSYQKYSPVGEAARRWMRNSHIETIVTDKHIRLWQQFLDTSLSHLVVFEDDVVFKDDSIHALTALIREVAAQPASRPIYVDLAGGCKQEDLSIDKLVDCHTPYGRLYKKPVTNTACAYLLNRATVVLFVNHLVQRPWLRLIGIDWMMNKLFMLSQLQEGQVYCLHTEPTMFQHGSTTGHYVTWQA